MSVRQIAFGLLFLVGIAVIITIVAYFANIWLLSDVRSMTPHEAFFIEGVLLLVSGFLLLVGRGGIDIWAIREAFRRNIWSRVAVDSNEPMRRERWPPQGFIRFALLLLITGFLMLATYFLGRLLRP